MVEREGAVKRLAREYIAFRKEAVPHIEIRPSPDNFLVFHFVLFDLPKDTPYYNGVYHGRLEFPSTYPFSPPKIFMVTPNGRFECNRSLCFSMTEYHPELWNPMWRVGTMVNAFLSFMLDASDPSASGSIVSSHSVKRKFAVESFEFNRRNAVFKKIFPEFCDESKFLPDIGFTFKSSSDTSESSS